MRRFAVHIVTILLLFVGGSADVCAQYDKDMFSYRGRQALADGNMLRR